jgi:hypothetical protein
MLCNLRPGDYSVDKSIANIKILPHKILNAYLYTSS